MQHRFVYGNRAHLPTFPDDCRVTVGIDAVRRDNATGEAAERGAPLSAIRVVDPLWRRLCRPVAYLAAGVASRWFLAVVFVFGIAACCACVFYGADYVNDADADAGVE